LFAATQRVFSQSSVALFVLFSPLDVPVPHRGRHDYGRSALIELILIVRLFASSDKCDTVYLRENGPVGIPGYLFDDAGQAAGCSEAHPAESSNDRNAANLERERECVPDVPEAPALRC
jgi:hypothetical protein